MSKINAQQKINRKISSKKRKISPITFIILIVVAVLLVGGITLYAMLGDNTSSYNVVVTPDNVDKVLADIESSDKTPIGSYEVYMNTIWNFNDSSATSTDAIVGNKATNSNTVYFIITLKDSGEQVYKSPNIPVGSNLENIVLDKKLSAGNYPAIITYYLLDDNNTEQSHVSVNMTLSIQS